MEVSLSKAITTHQGLVKKIKIQPVTFDVMAKHVTMPITFVRTGQDSPPAEIIDYALVRKYLSDLTGLDEIELGQLSATDTRRCVVALAQMLYEEDAGN